MFLRRSIALLIASYAIICVAAQPGYADPETVSCYGAESGALTASGEPFDPEGFTAAHPYLPFGTLLGISYRGNYVVVRVNDRGDYFDAARGVHRWDLSQGACEAIGLWDAAGVDVVDVEIL